MTTHLLRRAAAATAGLAAVLSTVAVAAPASAEAFAHTDPDGDVSSIAGVQPEVTNGDIRRVRFEHARGSVTVRAGFRDLAKTSDGIQQYVVVETPTRTYEFVVVAGPGDRRGQFIPVTSVGPCGGADFRLDYARNVFTLTLPRGCVGSPRWVRVGLATVTGFNEQEEQVILVDDALQRGFFIEDRLGLSPRLSRAGGAYTG